MRLLLSLLLHLQVSRHPQRSTLFPYTTLFRSRERAEIEVDVDVDDAERDVEGLRRAIDSLGGAAGTAGRIGAIGGGIAVLGGAAAAATGDLIAFTAAVAPAIGLLAAAQIGREAGRERAYEREGHGGTSSRR